MKKAALILAILMVCCAKENVPNDAAVRVNGTWIKKDQINRYAEMYREELLRAYPEKALQGLPPDLNKNIARQLIANEVVLQEAKKRKIGYSREKYQTTFDGIRKRFQDSAMFAAELAKMGQTEADVKGQIVDGLTVDSMMKLILRPVDSATVQECKAYYDANQASFASEKRYRASQVLFLVKKDATPDQKKTILQSAQKVLAEVKAGKDFAAEAKKYSQDPTTKAAGGDIGWFKHGDLMKEFETAVMTLQMNQVSDVFETAVGFHIIKKTGEETLAPQTFDKVESQIKTMLLLKKQNDVVKHFVDSLMTTAHVFYADTSLKAPLTAEK